MQRRRIRYSVFLTFAIAAIYVADFASAIAGTADAPSVQKRNSLIVLRCSRTRLVLDEARAFALVSLRDIPADVEFGGAEFATDLFRIGWSRTEADGRPGRLQWIRASDAKEHTCRIGGAPADRADLVFHHPGGLAVDVTCTFRVRPEEGRITAGLRITATGALQDVVIEQVVFPAFGLRLEPRENDGNVSAAVVAGLTKGGVFPDPKNWRPGQGITARQPGNLAAQFGCLYSRNAGMCCFTCDARGYPKTLQIVRSPQGLGWEWRHDAFHRLDPSRPFSLPYDAAWVAFGPADPDRPVDWRDGADAYRAWAQKQPWTRTPLSRRTDLPQWLLDGPGMVRFHRSWPAHPERIEAWLNEYWGSRFRGIPLIVALWGWEHVSSWVAPEYFPPFPSEEGFARTVQAIRRAGGHAFPWPSGYHWALDFNKQADGSWEWEDHARFEKEARPHTVVKRDGSLLIWTPRWLRGGHNAVLCRGDSWTRAWFTGVCRALVQRGCDMIQVDQVVGGATPLTSACYSPAHGHPVGPGLWNSDAFREQLRDITAACRPLASGGFVVGFEEPQELFLDIVGIQDYRDFQPNTWPRLPGRRPASVFAYLYHEYVPLFQSNPRPGDSAGMAWQFVTGQIPHAVPHWPVSPGPLLRNPGFETWNGDRPENWERVRGWRGKSYTGAALHDTTERHAGKAALRLENTEPGQIVQISQNIPIGPGFFEPGRTYRLSAWFKAAPMAHPNHIAIAALTRDLKGRGHWSVPVRESPTWTRGAVTFTIPKNADFVRFMIHMQDPCTVWVDDLQIEKQTESGTFEPALTSGLPPGHAFYAAWVRLFHGRGRPFLLLGRMLHPPRITVTAAVAAAEGRGESDDLLPAVLANAFMAPDGRRAVALVNTTGAALQAAFRLGPREFRTTLAPWTPCLVEEPHGAGRSR